MLTKKVKCRMRKPIFGKPVKARGFKGLATATFYSMEVVGSNHYCTMNTESKPIICVAMSWLEAATRQTPEG